jgi:UDP-GlcNAc:undecaprenyl-phosphate/decaprenyl-phosphate GlcNAc-1-phosphate transferase
MNVYLITLSGLITSILVYFSQKYFLKTKRIVKINNRSSHNVIATSNGGLAIFLTLFTISSWNYINGVTLFDYSLLIPLAIMVAIGIYDDNKTVDFKLKFIFQIIVAKIIVDNGFIIDNLHGFLYIYELSNILAQSFTIIVVVGIINAVNFIDGIDGLALTIISIFLISFEFFIKSFPEFRAISSILLGSFAPIFIFNFRKKNKVFLGDGGSLFLGSLVSIYTIFILSNQYIIKDDYDLNKILFVISILIYPFLDISRVFFFRIIKGQSPFVADKNHIHHVLSRYVKSHLFISIIIGSLTLLTILIFQVLF